MAKPILTLAQAQSLFAYDPISGALTQRIKGKRIASGQVAGYLHVKSGDWRISINGVKYQKRQVAWLMGRGVWPVLPICHANDDKSDHRCCNLVERVQPKKVRTPKERLTVLRLRALLHYDPDTGEFTRLKDGRLGGHLHHSGYVHIRADGISYNAHRLAWLYMTGQFPIGVIDHIDGVKHNNCWVNLRDVTQHVNMQNQRVARSDSRSGVLGVVISGSRWQASIKIDGLRKYLGTFDTSSEAHAAYLSAKREFHQGCKI